MPKVELLYFGNCPNIGKAREALSVAGGLNVIEVNQDLLEEGDFRRRYSSPTVILDGEIVAGSENDGACCSMIDWQKVSKIISRHISLSKRKRYGAPF